MEEIKEILAEIDRDMTDAEFEEARKRVEEAIDKLPQIPKFRAN